MLAMDGYAMTDVGYYAPLYQMAEPGHCHVPLYSAEWGGIPPTPERR